MKKILFCLLLSVSAVSAHADAVDSLRAFVSGVKTGEADFTQVVTSPDGAKKKTSSGHFEFARPNRFRFAYVKPFEQVIVADGQKVWIYDTDLNQVSTRRLGDALGVTPAALLAGGSLDASFSIKPLADREGMNWAEAIPKSETSAFKSLRVGFKGSELSVLEINDNFGQTSRLQFTQWRPNQALPAERFQFKPPAGADVLEQ